MVLACVVTAGALGALITEANDEPGTYGQRMGCARDGDYDGAGSVSCGGLRRMPRDRRATEPSDANPQSGEGSVSAVPETSDGGETAVDSVDATGSAPSPPSPVVQEPAYEPQGDAEATICAVFGAYCSDALAVARCESGPDYWADVGVHVGAFQLSVRFHADKFAAHGWDIYADGSDIYRTSVIAYEIFAGRGYSWLGTSGWPVCGQRAGY
jgi:hypothetical protein